MKSMNENIAIHRVCDENFQLKDMKERETEREKNHKS